MINTIRAAIETVYVEGIIRVKPPLNGVFYNAEAIKVAKWSHEELQTGDRLKAYRLSKVALNMEKMYNEKRNEKILVGGYMESKWVRRGYELGGRLCPPRRRENDDN